MTDDHLRKKRAVLFIAFLAITLFGLYWRTFQAAMIWDDKVYFQQNLLFAENRPPADAFKIGSLREQMGLDNSDLYYRPLLTVTFLVENRLWGLHPAPLRIVNLLIFLGALVVFYFFFMSLEPGGYFAEIAVFLFALIPLNVDNIVWIVGRGDLMMLLWAGLAFLGLERFIKTGRRAWLGASSLACLLGLFTKESFLLFIPVLVLTEAVRRKRITIPYHAANVLAAAAFFVVKNGILGIKGLKLVPYKNPVEILLAGLGALGYYARTALFPFTYDLFKPTRAIMSGAYPWIGVAAAILILGVIIRLRKSPGPWIPLSLVVLFMAGHVPLVWTNLFPYQVYSRYMMVPALGLAWIAAHYLIRLPERVRMTIATVLLVALIPSVVLNSGHYMSETAFWRHAKKISPRDAYVDFQLAQTFSESKDVLTAEIILNNSLVLDIRREVAIMISLLYSDLEYTRANYSAVEKWNSSVEQMEKDENVRIGPYIRYNINYNRARAALSQEDPASAERLLEANIQKYPNVRQAYTELYNLYLGYEMWDKAAGLEKVLKSRFPMSYSGIDTARIKGEVETAPAEKKIGFFVMFRNFGKAIELFQTLGRDGDEDRIFLAKLYYWDGKAAEGMAIMEALANRRPGDIRVLNKIGGFYLNDVYRAAEAVEFFRKSLAVKKNQPEIVSAVTRIERDYLARLKPVWK
jgi:hypothetical protein